MGALFGTDGIRGRADEAPLDEVTLRAIGAALGRVLASDLAHAPRVVLGRDTRESGPRVMAALAAGLAAAGAAPRSAGVIPTPGVALLARRSEFDIGVMVSASHNPWRDNGVKVFSHEGTKLADGLEAAIEAEVARELARGPAADGGLVAPPADEPQLARAHADWLVERGFAAGGLAGLSLVADCAHGAASAFAGDVLRRLGAEVEVIHAAPDGRNINDGCGSLHLDSLARAVREAGADAGVAFDGDADRALFVAHDGRAVDGDQALLISADTLRAAGRLRGGAIVGTVMSNFGLERALAERGLGLIRESVGDRNVLLRMQRDGCNLGGEPSGHVIFLDEAPTGDGLLTAIQVLCAVRAAGEPLAALAARLPRTPQVLRNVKVKARVPLESIPGWPELVGAWTQRLGSNGRLLVRYSGTEPLVRVMAEGADERLVTDCADALARHLAGAVGA